MIIVKVKPFNAAYALKPMERNKKVAINQGPAFSTPFKLLNTTKAIRNTAATGRAILNTIRQFVYYLSLKVYGSGTIDDFVTV
jgi:hypothetical protein